MGLPEIARLHERIDQIESCEIDQKEFGRMVANIGSLCERVTTQSNQIAKLSDELRAISDQMLAGKSGLQGFRMGVVAAMVFVSGGIGAGISTLLDKVFKI